MSIVDTRNITFHITDTPASTSCHPNHLQYTHCTWLAHSPHSLLPGYRSLKYLGTSLYSAAFILAVSAGILSLLRLVWWGGANKLISVNAVICECHPLTHVEDSGWYWSLTFPEAPMQYKSTQHCPTTLSSINVTYSYLTQHLVFILSFFTPLLFNCGRYTWTLTRSLPEDPIQCMSNTTDLYQHHLSVSHTTLHTFLFTQDYFLIVRWSEAWLVSFLKLRGQVNVHHCPTPPTYLSVSHTTLHIFVFTQDYFLIVSGSDAWSVRFWYSRS